MRGLCVVRIRDSSFCSSLRRSSAASASVTIPAPTYARTASATDSTCTTRLRLPSRPPVNLHPDVGHQLQLCLAKWIFFLQRRQQHEGSSPCLHEPGALRPARQLTPWLALYSACARFPGTGPSVTLRSLFPSASVSLRISPALALIVPRVPRRPALPPCASPVYRCPAFLLGPLEFPAGKRGLGRRTADSLLPSKGNLRSNSSSFSTIPSDPHVRSSSRNFSPRLANPYIPSRASSNHDMTRPSSSPPYLRKYPSLLSSLRVRLT